VRGDGYRLGWCQRVLIWVWDGRVSKNLLIPAMNCAKVFRGELYQVSCWDLERADGKARWGRVGMWAQGGVYEHRVMFRQSGRFLGGWAVGGPA
jgi:hypothetical protein